MTTHHRLAILGYDLEFSGCEEMCQGGPLACTLTINGELVERRVLCWAQTSLRFDPSPLEHDGAILVPLLTRNVWTPGYVLTRINPATRQVRIVSRLRPYMKLLRIDGQAVVFATKAYGSETDFYSLT